MKIFVFIIGIGLLSVVAYYGLALRSAALLCSSQHQGSIDRLITQSQTVLADQKEGCTQSFSVLTEWGMCDEKAGEAVPFSFRRYMRSMISSIMMFLREKNKDVDVLKREHDERCKTYTELIFFPPDIE